MDLVKARVRIMDRWVSLLVVVVVGAHDLETMVIETVWVAHLVGAVDTVVDLLQVIVVDMLHQVIVVAMGEVSLELRPSVSIGTKRQFSLSIAR